MFKMCLICDYFLMGIYNVINGRIIYIFYFLIVFWGNWYIELGFDVLFVYIFNYLFKV